MSRGQLFRKAGDALLALLVPKNAAGKVDTTQMALRYAPDVLYSGLTSAMLPPGATGGERFGAGAEDLGISLLGSVLGQTAGAGAARAMGKKLGSDAGNLAVTLGDMGVQAPLRMLAPRPVLENAYERINQENQATQAEVAQAQQEVQEQQVDQELLNLMLNAGYFGGRAIT